MKLDLDDDRPIIVAIAGSNGAGKSTFFEAFLSNTGLRFVNADTLAQELNINPYEAAAVAKSLREALVAQRASFIFETVFSDPVGEKVTFLEDAVAAGYQVILVFISISSIAISDERVALRVSQGGHDVPYDKLQDRFARTQQNLKLAIESLPIVVVYDNSDLTTPYRLRAVYLDGELVEGHHIL